MGFLSYFFLSPHPKGWCPFFLQKIYTNFFTLPNLNIDDLVLIQLDVEGHEISALKGAQATIRKNRPVIAIEDNSNNCSEFLLDIKYEKVGQLPGLTIWSPTENNAYKEKIVSILT